MNTTHSSRHRIAVLRRPRSISAMLALVIMLLLSTAPTAWQTEAAHLEDDQIAPAEATSTTTPLIGTPVTEPPNSGDPDGLPGTVESTPAATESVIAPTVAASGTAMVVRERPGVVEVTLWLCPPNVELPTLDHRLLAGVCVARSAGVHFQLDDGGGLAVSRRTGTAGLSKVRFEAVDPGALTVRQFPTPDAAAVFCGGNTQAETTTNYGPAYFDGRYLHVEAQSGELLQCDWYVTNSSLEDANIDTSSFLINLLECPAVFDAGSESMSDYARACQEDPKPVEFTYSQAGSPLPIASMTNANDRFSALVNPGPVTITETIPDGFGEPVVFCTGQNPALANIRMGVVDGDSIEWTLLPGQKLLCNWFNIPESSGEPWEPARIVIASYWCSPSVVWAKAPTESDYKAACREDPLTATFTLEGGGQYWPAQSAQGGPPETVTWAGLPPGDYAFAETGVAQARTPQVFCHESSGDELDSAPADVDRAIDGGILWTAGSGTTLTCNWFNFAAEPGSITLRLWTCPPGYDPYGSHAAPETDCTVAANGVTFVLDDLDVFELVYLEARTGDAIEGEVHFNGLQPGHYRIREVVPEGTDLVFVGGCKGFNTGPMHISPLSVGPEIDVRVMDGGRVMCDWYNVPAHASAVDPTPNVHRVGFMPLGRPGMDAHGID